MLLSAYGCAICVAGVVVCVDSRDASIGFSDPAIELVDVSLRAYPTEGEMVSV